MVTTIYETAKKSGNNELKVQVGDFIDQLNELKFAQGQIIDENQTVRAENQTLKEEIAYLKTASTPAPPVLTFSVTDHMYDKRPEGGKSGPVDGPYCPHCWDSEQKMIRMLNPSASSVKYFQCPHCKTVVNNNTSTGPVVVQRSNPHDYR